MSSWPSMGSIPLKMSGFHRQSSNIKLTTKEIVSRLVSWYFGISIVENIYIQSLRTCALCLFALYQCEVKEEMRCSHGNAAADLEKRQRVQHDPDICACRESKIPHPHVWVHIYTCVTWLDMILCCHLVQQGSLTQPFFCERTALASGDDNSKHEWWRQLTKPKHYDTRA